MTDLLLKNKKLLNDDITGFIYNNELFSNQITDIMTLFEKRYNTKNLSIYDKVAIYKFSEGNKSNIFIKNMINDFITLIKFLNDKRKENNNNKENDITEETKLYELVDKLKDSLSNTNFIKMFEQNEGLTIDKTTAIFLYYLKLIYKDLEKEIKNYQINLKDESKEIINNYYKEEHTITKKDFASAIRLFITLVLYLEEDKDNKILSNCNNIVNYLKSSDLWSKDIYSNDDFNKNLNELKSFNIQINQIINLYEFLGKDIEDNFYNDVKEQIKKNEEEQYKKMKTGNESNDDPDTFIKKGTEEEEEDEDLFKNESGDESEDGNGNRD